MTQVLSQNALLKCYASEIDKFYLGNNIFSNILLIVDNAPEHPPFIGDLHTSIKVVFFFPLLMLFFNLFNGLRGYSSL